MFSLLNWMTGTESNDEMAANAEIAETRTLSSPSSEMEELTLDQNDQVECFNFIPRK